ncbi:MAG: histidine kinase [Clostridiaceae bacterium]|nr:histidine kinase [Clostridiaceae bacterium]
MRLSIRNKLFITITVVYMAILLISITYISQYLKNILLERSQEEQQRLLIQSASSIEQVINELDRITLYLTGDRYFASILNSDPQNDVDTIGVAGKLKDSVGVYTSYSITSSSIDYKTTLYIDDSFDVARYLPSYGLDTAFYRTGEKTNICSSTAVKDCPWYLDTVSYNSQVYSFTDDNLDDYLLFAKLLRNSNVGEASHNNIAGTIVMALRKHDMETIMNTARTTDHTEIMLIKNNMIIAATGSETIANGVVPDKYQPIMELEQDSNFHSTNIGGQSCLGIRSGIAGQWELASVVPLADITGQVNHLTSQIVIIVIAFSVLVLFAAAILSRFFAKPIQRLSSVMSHVKTEEEIAVVTTNYKYKDEIAELYTSYNIMITRIQNLVNNVKVKAELQKKAELRALQAQINPHFIYNTLDTINWIAMCEKQKNISTMVTALVSIIRYSVKDPDAMVSLDAEINYLKEYWSIQNIRYQGKYSFHIQIPANLLKVELPKMSIQPLVENAINYAQPDSGDNVIGVAVYEKGEQVEIIVSDTGKNADSGLLNRYLEHEDVFTSQGSGIGIRNVNDRIKMYFGSEFGLLYKNTAEGLQAVLRIKKLSS